MRERPILFTDPMVRAILEGRKTQTRRVAKLTASAHVKEPGGHRRWHPADPDATMACPYGQPGDRLWVREAFDPIEGQSPTHPVIGVDYRASHPTKYPTEDDRHKAGSDAINIYQWRIKDSHGMRKWKPSIHMPRWASRIDLEITGVRVERLQEISEADAAVEGIAPNWIGNDLTGWLPEEHGYLPHDTDDEGNVPGVDIYDDCWTAKRCYQRLWESLNGPGSWAANPWVWVIEFKRL